MSSEGTPGYQVHHSAFIAQMFRDLQVQATQEERGREFLDAAKEALARLTTDPFEFGEPRYRLPVLHLQVRSAIIRPLVIHFAVHEEEPLVYIHFVKLLSRQES
jgi:hypothetical protein